MSRLFLLTLLLFLSACRSPKVDLPPVPAPAMIGGCNHDHKLPPLELDADDLKLLRERSGQPKTAADFYFLLPGAYFSILEHTPERRATYIDKTTLSANYLHAKHWFECDGGGFELTIRLFKGETGPLVAIASSKYENVVLQSKAASKPGDLTDIDLSMPRFWRWSDGAWISIPQDILPRLDRDFIIDRYKNHYHGHLNEPSQGKTIWLDYELPKTGEVIQVTGRENFMDPFLRYVWAAYRFNGSRFVRQTKLSGDLDPQPD